MSEVKTTIDLSLFELVPPAQRNSNPNLFIISIGAKRRALVNMRFTCELAERAFNLKVNPNGSMLALIPDPLGHYVAMKKKDGGASFSAYSLAAMLDTRKKAIPVSYTFSWDEAAQAYIGACPADNPSSPAPPPQKRAYRRRLGGLEDMVPPGYES